MSGAAGGASASGHGGQGGQGSPGGGAGKSTATRDRTYWGGWPIHVKGYNTKTPIPVVDTRRSTDGSVK